MANRNWWYLDIKSWCQKRRQQPICCSSILLVFLFDLICSGAFLQLEKLNKNLVPHGNPKQPANYEARFAAHRCHGRSPALRHSHSAQEGGCHKCETSSSDIRRDLMGFNHIRPTNGNILGYFMGYGKIIGLVSPWVVTIIPWLRHILTLYPSQDILSNPIIVGLASGKTTRGTPYMSWEKTSG